MTPHNPQEHRSTKSAQKVANGALPSSESSLGQIEMHLYTRHEHGNCPVRVYQTSEGQTRYELTVPSDEDGSGRRTMTFTSARALISSLYGHDVHMSFDRYFRLGRYRQAGRASGRANLLTLLDDKEPQTRTTPIALHSTSTQTGRKTPIAISKPVQSLVCRGLATSKPESGGVYEGTDPALEEFVNAMQGDLLPYEEFVIPNERMKEELEKAFALELDRVEGLVGIELGGVSGRKGARTRADEVRRLLWKGFAGKMLSRGYDPDEVLQEVYRGLLVRNHGRCPWDARKSTFGHYVHMVISCVLTNYHRKQMRRPDRDALSLTGVSKEGDEVELPWGTAEIHDGSEIGDRMALEELARHLEGVPSVEPEAELGKRILPLVASGHQRAEIVRETGEKPSVVSRALAWLRRQAATWAAAGGLEGHVPARYA